jgi:hypothetical protein
MNSRVTFLLIAIALFPLEIISQTTNSIQPQKKIALVIGNGNYISGMPLPNPENDARSIKDALQNVGFTVMEYENLNRVQMMKAIDDFGDKLKNNDVGLFFYAGHGIQSKGYNYLIPVDAQLKSEQQVEYDCVQADRVLALMDGSGSKVNIIILDACRNNPFERSWTRSVNGSGLAFMNAPSGTLIAYATSPGKTASDGSGNNGLYTSAILESIKIPNITILQMFQNVRSIVSQKSNKQQVPWESTSLTGDFYFNIDKKNDTKQNPSSDYLNQQSSGVSNSIRTSNDSLSKSSTNSTNKSIKANVFIYRPNIGNGILRDCKVFLDSRNIGSLPNKGRIQINNVKRGIYTLLFKIGNSTSSIQLKVLTNDDIYIRWTDSGPIFVDPSLGNQSFSSLSKEIVIVN